MEFDLNEAGKKKTLSVMTKLLRRSSMTSASSVETEVRECFQQGKGEEVPLLPPLQTDRKTLVLDLDETLIHSSLSPEPDFAFSFPLNIDDRPVQVYVNTRPCLSDFLSQMSLCYEIVVFTTSLPSYADPLISQIDPKGLISHRLYRDSCLFHDGRYIKDLSRLGRDLKNVLIVDVRGK